MIKNIFHKKKGGLMKMVSLFAIFLNSFLEISTPTTAKTETDFTGLLSEKNATKTVKEITNNTLSKKIYPKKTTQISPETPETIAQEENSLETGRESKSGVQNSSPKIKLSFNLPNVGPRIQPPQIFQGLHFLYQNIASPEKQIEIIVEGVGKMQLEVGKNAVTLQKNTLQKRIEENFSVNYVLYGGSQ